MIIEKLIDKDELSETEYQIAQYILNKENDIEDMSSTELGRKSFTSQSSVTRLYKKLGLKTYREFLSKVIIERNEYFHTKDVIDNLINDHLSSYEGILKIVSGLHVQTMMSTNRVMEKNVIMRLCNRILSSKMIDIYAIGQSESISRQMACKLQSLGIYCSCHNSYNPLYIRNILNKTQRVALIIVVDEENEIVKNIAKALREEKVYTVSICSIKEKELMLFCQDNINYSVGCYEHFESLCSFFATEYILNIIYMVLRERNIKQKEV